MRGFFIRMLLWVGFVLPIHGSALPAYAMMLIAYPFSLWKLGRLTPSPSMVFAKMRADWKHPELLSRFAYNAPFFMGVFVQEPESAIVPVWMHRALIRRGQANRATAALAAHAFIRLDRYADAEAIALDGLGLPDIPDKIPLRGRLRSMQPPPKRGEADVDLPYCVALSRCLMNDISGAIEALEPAQEKNPRHAGVRALRKHLETGGPANRAALQVYPRHVKMRSAG